MLLFVEVFELCHSVVCTAGVTSLCAVWTFLHWAAERFSH